MKKTIIIAILFCIIFALSACGASKTEEKSLQDVSHTVAVKMTDANGEVKYVTSEIEEFRTFSQLNIKPSQKLYDGKPLYRFVFDPEEIVKGRDPITVNFCEDALFINGAAFEAADGVNYADILAWAEGKYTAFGVSLPQD